MYTYMYLRTDAVLTCEGWKHYITFHTKCKFHHCSVSLSTRFEAFCEIHTTLLLSPSFFSKNFLLKERFLFRVYTLLSTTSFN